MPTATDPFDLTPATGFFVGYEAFNPPAVYGDFWGWSVSSAGDVNGDGYDDVIIGIATSLSARTPATRTGNAYVVFGQGNGLPDVDLGALTPAQGFVIRGSGTNSFTGLDVAAGDINGDGYSDLIVGAPGHPFETGYGRGTYVVFGHAGQFGAVELSGLATHPALGMALLASDGRSVASLGDLNNDGFDDLMMGYPGSATAGSATVHFGAANPDPAGVYASINGDRQGDRFGTSVSSAGDVNGDGFGDLVIGAPNHGDSAGEVYVLFGDGGTTFVSGVSGLQAARGFVIRGDTADDYMGRSVSSAGDVNGDGYDDLIVGTWAAGKAYVIFGSGDGFGGLDGRGRAIVNLANLGSGGFVIQSSEDGGLGFSVSGAGDVNGDGYDDVIVSGAASTTPGFPGAYVLFGRGTFSPVLDLAALTPDRGFIIPDWGSGARTVSAAGDVNGDGFDDVILGAEAQGRTGQVVFGHATATGVTLTGTIDGDTLAGDFADDRIDGLDGNDHLSGLRSNDDLRGGAGDDTLDGGQGYDILNGGLGADTMAGGRNNDLYYVDEAGDLVIENANEGTDTVRSRIDYVLGDNVENLILGSAGRVGTGNALANVIQGSNGNGVLRGFGGNDTLIGGNGRDKLIGGVGNDVIHGGGGMDTLTGGTGRDVFAFADGDMGAKVAVADLITDFSLPDGETIDLAAVDANAAVADDQAFVFIRNAAFSDTAGELRVARHAGMTFVQGDVDGDGTADFVISLNGLHNLLADDFIL